MTLKSKIGNFFDSIKLGAAMCSLQLTCVKTTAPLVATIEYDHNIYVLPMIIWLQIMMISFFFSVLPSVKIYVERGPPPTPAAAVHPPHDGLLHRVVPSLGPQASSLWRAGWFRAGSCGGLLHSKYPIWRKVQAGGSTFCPNSGWWRSQWAISQI